MFFQFLSARTKLLCYWNSFLFFLIPFYRHVCHVNRTLIIGCGPFVRTALGLASYIWAFQLWGANGEVFLRPNYYVLSRITTENFLAWLFFIHGLAITWRLYDRRPRTLWSLFINVYGFILWTGTIASIYWSVDGPVPVASLDVVGCLGAFIAICVNDVRWWKHITP